MKKKVLIIGNGSSIFVKEQIQYVLLDGQNDIYVTYNKNRDTLYMDFYKENGINIIDTHNKNSFFGRIPKFGVLYNLWKSIKKNCSISSFDVINVHGLNSYVLLYFITNILKKYTKRIVCTWYGSDIMTASDKFLIRLENLFSKIDAFTMSTDNLVNRFKSIYGNKYDSKIFKAPFGLSNLYFIDENNENELKDVICDSESEKKIIVSIGHNRCEEQQHKCVIEQIKKLPEHIKLKICILLQLTYGSGSDDYVNDVIDYAKTTGCTVEVLNKYMYGDEIAKMVNKVDIYINSQKSDAMSGAMLEYLYAKTIVINPRWIDYDELLKKGCSFIYYDSFDALPNILENILVGNINLNLKKNHDVIKSLSHWDVAKEYWLNVFFSYEKLT